MQESIVFLVRVQCRRKESSRSLSHLLMSFLYYVLSMMSAWMVCCLIFYFGWFSYVSFVSFVTARSQKGPQSSKNLRPRSEKVSRVCFRVSVEVC